MPACVDKVVFFVGLVDRSSAGRPRVREVSDVGGVLVWFPCCCDIVMLNCSDAVLWCCDGVMYFHTSTVTHATLVLTPKDRHNRWTENAEESTLESWRA